MSRLHNRPNTEVMHIPVQSGVFAGTVTKSFSGYAGEYALGVAFSTDSVSAASSVVVKPFADVAQSVVGLAINFGESNAGTVAASVIIGTGTNAEVHSATPFFAPFGFQIVFSTTQGGSGTVDFFARLRG